MFKISVSCLAAICVVGNLYAIENVSPQIQKLLAQKQEKITALEKCDGKRKGFMIAGISTIGLTAVGVGVNIAQANKSSNLSGQIEAKNKELATQQANLKNINSQITKLEQDQARTACEQGENTEWSGGRCIEKVPGIVQQEQPVVVQAISVAAPGVPVADTGPTEPKVDATKWTKEAYQQCFENFSAINYSGLSIVRSYWSKSHNGKWCEGYYGGKYFYDYKKNPNPCTKSKFTSLANGEWTITLKNGKNVGGIAMCSTTKGSTKDELRDSIDTNGNGQHCWCKITKTDLSECLVTQKFSWAFMDGFAPVDALDMEDKGVYDEYHNPMPDAYYQLGQNTCPWQCANECAYQLLDYGNHRVRALHGVPLIKQYILDMQNSQ